MKRTATLFVALAAITTISIEPPSAAADGKLDEVLAKMERAARAIKTIEADMNQEKRDASIGGPPERYAGKIYFSHAGKNNDKVRINYTTPAGQAVSVVGNDIILYQPSIKQAIITSRQAQAAKNQEFSFIATPYKSVPELKNQYNIVYAGQEQVASGAAAKLELTPKAKSSVQKLTLWVDEKISLPTKYQVVENNRNITTFILTNVKLNERLPGNIFKISWPSDTKVLRK